MLGQMRRNCLYHGRLDRTDIRQDRALGKMGPDDFRHHAAGPDRHAQDYQIGQGNAGHRIGCGQIGQTQRLDPFDHGRIAVNRGDGCRNVLAADTARQRGADQAEADQRDMVEQRGRQRRTELIRHET